MKKGVIYTTIIGGKDTLKEIPLKACDPDWDYFCFTDDPTDMYGKGWKLIGAEIDKQFTPRRYSKLFKIIPHRNKYLKEYEYQIHLDGTLTLQCNPNDLIETLNENDISVYAHPNRICIYEEAKVVKKDKRDFPDIIDKTVNFLREENYPENNGLVAASLIVRKNTEQIQAFNDLWYDTWLNYSQRDQLSFNYCIWKMQIPYSKIKLDYSLPNKYTSFSRHLIPGKLTDGVLFKNKN